jgi:transcriptional regulator with XRE-family HTH domain
MARNGEYPDLEARFRERFIAARKRRGYSQDDVAAEIKVTQQTVARFENSKRGLSVNDMPRWANAIGEDWRSLVAEERGSKSELRRALADKKAELQMRRYEANNAAAALERAEQQARLREADVRRTQALMAVASADLAEIERQISEKDA